MSGLSSYGLAPHEEIREVNLLRERTSLHRDTYRVARRYVFGLSAMLAANLLFVPPLWHWGRVESAQAADLTKRVAAVDSGVAREQLVAQRLSGLQATAERRVRSQRHILGWVSCVGLIDSSLPSDAFLNKSTYTAKPGAIEIGLFGSGQSIRTVSLFTTLVSASPTFSSMRLAKTQKDVMMGSEGVQFDMSGVMTLTQ